MKKLSRRQFNKLASAAALAIPVAASANPLGAVFRPPASPQQPTSPQQPATPPPASKLNLTPDQEEAVRRAVERRDRQLAGLRSRTLPYALEPAFVFAVRPRPRPGRTK